MTFGRRRARWKATRCSTASLPAGGNFIDTADVYSQGASEEILGRWLAEAIARRSRDRHKAPLGNRRPGRAPPKPVRPRPKTHRCGRRGKSEAAKTDYIDLYQVHMWDPSAPLEETLSTLGHPREERKGPLPRRQQLFRLAAAEIRRPRESAAAGSRSPVCRRSTISSTATLSWSCFTSRGTKASA